MKKIVSILLFITLIGCTTVNNTESQPNSINNIVEAFKSIVMPK